jgi:DNA polymerase III alpha subunit
MASRITEVWSRLPHPDSEASKTFAIYAGAVICFGGLIFAGIRMMSGRFQLEMKDMGYQFPLYPVGDDETMDTFLYKRTMEGVSNRYGVKSSASLRKRAEKQVERELALIAKLGLSGYFLIVWDIVEFCRKNGILVQGRGSAANSAVCYALGITAVDPVGTKTSASRRAF